MKAYRYDEVNGYSTIIYAETRNQARVKALRYAIDENDDYLLKYKDVRVIRASWADKYRDFEIIPLVALLKVTGESPCKCCGEMVMDGEYAKDKLPYIICKDCAEEDCGVD